MVTYSKIKRSSSNRKIAEFERETIFSPKWACVEITTKCDHMCNWCYEKNSRKTKSHEEMSVPDFIKIIETLELSGVKQVTIGGGEPTSHSQFIDIVSSINSKNLVLHLNSNGDNIDKTAVNHLKVNNISQVNFNFQGRKWHDKIHGVDCYSSLLEKINQVRESKIETCGTVVVGQQNALDIEEILEDMVCAGLDKIRIWDATNCKKELLSVSEIKEINGLAKTKLSKYGYRNVTSYEPHVPADKHIPCPASMGLLIAIKVNADLVLCLSDDYNNYIGNVLKDDFNDIIDRLKNEISNKRKKYKKDICLARRY